MIGNKENLVGCHLSSTGGFMAMSRTMEEIGATTFQFFSRNPRGGRRRKEDPADLEAFLSYQSERGQRAILAHAPYTLNPASASEKVLEFADLVFQEDLKSLEQIPGSLYNFHPGSHVGQGTAKGIRLIQKRLNKAADRDLSTRILLETMSGKGTEIGSRFEELAEIMAGVEHNEILGVCLDTCHIHDAGYDIVDHPEQVMEEFDRIIGLDRLCAIHLNDSKNPLGSRRDRHEKIGSGSIGLEAFRRFLSLPGMRGIPIYLETPNDLAGYAKEIRLIRQLLDEAAHKEASA